MKILHSLIENGAFQKGITPLIISITLIFSLLIIATTPAATGDEVSIYGAYPTFLWVLILINIFFSIYAIIRSCDSRFSGRFYGYFSILLIETIVLLLPFIRGYYSMSRGGGDIYEHLFLASQISNSGYIPQTDIYPIMHIWLSILQNFSLDFIILAFIFSIVFFILYIIYLYIFGKIIIGTEKGGVFISIFGIPLIFSYCHYAFFPFLFALLTVPLILYSYQKIIQTPKQRSGFYICLVFLSSFIVFCHPIITIFLIIMFSTFVFYELFKGWKNGPHPHKIVALNVVTIISITFFFWFVHFRYFLNTTRSIISALIGDSAPRIIFDYQMNMISNISVFQKIEFFIKLYGSITVYFFISFLFLLLIIKQYYQFKKIYENDFIYAMQFCVATFVMIALTFGFFVIFEPIRAASYGIVFATIICGLFFYRIFYANKSEKRKLSLMISMTVILSIICLLAMLNVYYSPWNSGTGFNTALPYVDKNGIDWILEYRDTEIPIVKLDEPMSQYSNYYYYKSKNVKNCQNLIEYTKDIPSNFGYNTESAIGNTFAYLPENTVYMVTTEKMKMTPYAVPVEKRYQLKWFMDKDFFRLKNDPTVNLVYSSNGFGVWNINIR